MSSSGSVGLHDYIFFHNENVGYEKSYTFTFNRITKHDIFMKKKT